MHERIALTGKRGAGRFTLVDDGDVPLVIPYRWSLDTPSRRVEYARAWSADFPGGSIRMHVLIAGRYVDHANGDGLDNRRENLRPATAGQQMFNTRKRAGCSSAFKGVSWDKKTGKWVAYIGGPRTGRRVLGRFTDEIEAARTYDAAATDLFGPFARVNFPPAH